MSWYSIFYWITVADGVKEFFDSASNWFTTFATITFIVLCILTIAANDGFEKLDAEQRKSVKYWLTMIRRMFTWFLVLTVITWAGYVFCPNKRDALIIVAGGAVGEFITSDSAAKQIPSEVMVLLRDKIRSEIKEVKIIDGIRDTLEGKTREELIKIIQQK